MLRPSSARVREQVVPDPYGLLVMPKTDLCKRLEPAPRRSASALWTSLAPFEPPSTAPRSAS